MHTARSTVVFVVVSLFLILSLTLAATAQGSRDGDGFSDAQLTSAIVAELYWDPRVDADSIDVVVEDRFVILDGTVDSYSEAVAATEVSRSVRGVRAVENDLVVAQERPEDQTQFLSRRVEGVLDATVGVANQDIMVRSPQSGQVLLEGTVDSYSAKRRAVTAASNVVGVEDVVENIAVTPTASVSDEVIAQDVLDAIRRTTTVDLDRIDVLVESGQVRLEGQLGSSGDVAAVVDAASYTIGVTEVENNIDVVSAALGGGRSDAAVRKDVLDQLAWDDRVDATSISVDVDDGLVTLSGTVESYPARQAAAADAMSVTGVERVFNDLDVAVVRDRPSDDRLTATAIENALEWTEAVDTQDVSVSFRGGSVLLEGSVRSLWAKQRVGSLVSDIRGVTDVDNRLSVVPEDDISDEEIAARITDKLTSRFFLDSTDITVVVDDGIVSLVGTVDSDVEREMAVDVALRTEGVRGIESDLSVED